MQNRTGYSKTTNRIPHILRNAASYSHNIIFTHLQPTLLRSRLSSSAGTLAVHVKIEHSAFKKTKLVGI